MNKRVIFYAEGEPVGEIYRDDTGQLVATTERVQWIADEPIDIGSRRIQPGEEDFLDLLPLAYAGSLFYSELVER